MRVVIADDEPLARSLLRALLEEAGGIEVVGEAESGGEIMPLVERLRPDAVFLDIDMPGGDGIGAAHAVQSRSLAHVVFITAHELHAVDAYDLGAVDYVLKPVRRARLAKALERVRERLRGGPAAEVAAAEPAAAAGEELVFWVRARNGMVRVPAAEILWIEAARDHVYFHTGRQSHLHRITMDELEEKLAGSALVRVQRSAFVRLDKVTAILRRGKTMLLELENATRVPLGPRYQADILKRLTGVERRALAEA